MKNNMLIKVLSLILLLPSHWVGAITLVAGNEYKVSKDVLSLLADLDETGSLQDRWRFSKNGILLKSPSWKDEDVKLYRKLTFQSLSYSETRVAKWKKRIEKLENMKSKELAIKSTMLDLNNDGNKEKVVSFSVK